MKAAGLLLLGGILIAGGAIALAFGMGNLWGIVVGFVGLTVCLLTTMAGIFAGVARDKADKFRFNGLSLLGLLLPFVGVALWWHLGGLIGAGAGVVAFGLGAVMVGVGLIVGLPSSLGAE